MTKLHPLSSMIARAAAVAICMLPGLAFGEPVTDLHDITVGMSASQLPAEGYRDFTCAGRSIAQWSDWALCSVGGDGLRPMHIAFGKPGDDTKVAGHPVNLTVFFDDTSRLVKIEIKTDDHVPLYLHKKAYMLAHQAKTHYGEDGWTCHSVSASAEEESIGSIYINEACTKLSVERRVEVSDRLFRRKGDAPRDFVSETTISISLLSATSKRASD